MRWADVERLYRYWNESPPAHELVAAAVGFKPPPHPTQQGGKVDVGLSFEEARSHMNTGTPIAAGGMNG